MANSFPSPIVPPDPNRFGTGQKLLAETANCFQDLAEAFNHGHAWFGAHNVVTQGWGDDLASTAAAMPAAGTTHARWRIPELGPAWTSVTVEVYAEKAGAGDGSVRFQSTEGGDTETLTIPAGGPAWVSGTLDVAYHADGYETVDMTIAGDGDATTVHEVRIAYEPLTSPLAAAASGTFTPFDAAEIDADSVCSSDLGVYMRNNLRTFIGDASGVTYPGRRRVVYQWSDLGSIQSGMTSLEHRIYLPVHYGSRARGYTVRLYVEATGLAGDSRIHIHRSPSVPGHVTAINQYDLVKIDVGAAAARAWYTTTIKLDDGERALERLPHPSTLLSIWPGTRDFGGVGDFSDERPQNSSDDTPTIHAVSAWAL